MRKKHFGIRMACPKCGKETAIIDTRYPTSTSCARKRVCPSGHVDRTVERMEHSRSAARSRLAELKELIDSIREEI